MHIIGGLILLAIIVFGGMFISRSEEFRSAFDPLARGLGIQFSTSTLSNSSAYYEEVNINFVSLGGGLNQPMIVSLKGANSSKNDGIVLTGWTLKTGEGTYSIPKVANLHSPSAPGVPAEDIYLKNGGTVNLYSGKNTQGNQQAIKSGAAEWQIWLNEDFLSLPHGTIILRDGAGKTVDEYKY